MSRWKRVRSGSLRAISSVKKQRRGALAAVDRGRAADDEPLAGSRCRSQAASSCSEPITLMSCSARAGLPGAGYQRIPQWTTVSALGAGEQPREQRAAQVGLDELGALEVRGGRLGVDPGDVLDRGVALEPARQLGRPSGRRSR